MVEITDNTHKVSKRFLFYIHCRNKEEEIPLLKQENVATHQEEEAAADKSVNITEGITILSRMSKRS